MGRPLYTITDNFLTRQECDDLVASFTFSGMGLIQSKKSLSEGKANVYAPNARIVDLSDIDGNHVAFKRAREKFKELSVPYELSELGWVSYNFLRYGVGGKFVKHSDIMIRDQKGSNRQLSMTIQLNDEYEGGEFIIYKPGNDIGKIVPLKKGSAVFFKSNILHEVRPITSGIRFALVIWFMTKSEKPL